MTLYYGSVGSGKTTAMIRDARAAYERGEPVFTNVAIDPEAGGWDASNGGSIHVWHEPIELIQMTVSVLDGQNGKVPVVRCGLVVFDELGAIVNNRESDFWPFALTVKLIEHRKDHLDFVASAQVDDMADKNMRRFYNRVYRCTEHRWPLVGLIWPDSQRPDKPCPWPGCKKDDGFIVRGDTGTRGTFYRLKDIDPLRTKNIEKHNSNGTRWLLFDPRIAAAYGTTAKVSEDAARWHEKAIAEYARRKASVGKVWTKRGRQDG